MFVGFRYGYDGVGFTGNGIAQIPSVNFTQVHVMPIGCLD